MAVLTIVITTAADTVVTLNNKCESPTKPHETMNLLIDYLAAIAGGTKASTVQVVTRASNPTVTTDGDPNSQTFTYNLT